jgi:hypothetical protein
MRAGCRRGTAVVLGALIVSFGASCPAALAKKKGHRGQKRTHQGRVVVVSERSPLGGSPVSVAPECPNGTRAVGGGFRAGGLVLNPATGSSRVGEQTLVYESRLASATSWVTSAVTYGEGQSGPFATSLGLTAKTYCRRFKGSITEAVSTGPSVTEASAASTATAACPGRTDAIAGGFSAAPIAESLSGYPSIYDSYPVGRRFWVVSANPWTSSAVGVTSYVYCAKRDKAAAWRAGTSPPEEVQCPRRLQVSDGGFRLTPDFGSVPFESDAYALSDDTPGVPIPTGIFWLAAGGNLLAPTPAPTAYAFCS